MARNGSGTFIRLYNWEQDAANNIRIRADRMDNEMDGMADALTGSIATDGQTPITANLPMSGFKHTNVADATQRNQYATWGQTQDNTSQWGGTDTGAADAYEISTTPVTTAYTAGQVYRFKVGSGNTNTGGAATLSVNGLPTRNLKDQDGNDPAAGEIRAAGFYEATYDGTNFIFGGYLSGTSFGSSLIGSADAEAARGVLELDSDDAVSFGSLTTGQIDLEGDIVTDNSVNIEMTSTGGLDVRTLDNDGNFILRVLSAGGNQRFQVEHNAPFLRGQSSGWTINGNAVLDESRIGTGSNQIPTNSQIDITTADVLSATAGASAGAVGTYAWLRRTDLNNDIGFGSTHSGSSLVRAGIRYIGGGGNEVAWDAVDRSSPSGTWRAVGEQGASTNHYAGTLFLRIS